jgi:hypothetical protein
MSDASAFESITQQDHSYIDRSDTLRIYHSADIPVTNGSLVICDFGCARLGDEGQKFEGDVMPNFYRAPKIILGMPWDSKIYIWSIGLMVHIFHHGSYRDVSNSRD